MTCGLVEGVQSKDPLPASSIYAFKGKVDGKFNGTCGVFISMSGYSEECVDALIHGKPLNILLFDEKDIEAIIGNNGIKGASFITVLTEKLFAAGQTGNVYLPWQDLQAVRRSIEAISNRPVFIFCEGSTDELIISSLLKYIQVHGHLVSDNVSLIAVHGRIAEIPSLIKLITTSAPGPGVIILVLDGDANARSMEKFLLNAQQDIPDTWEYHVAFATPTLETWTGLQQTSLKGTSKLAQLQRTISEVNWGLQANQIQELENVMDLLKKLLPYR